MNERIAIIGGGIAGLYAAWRLRTLRSTAAITVYEANNRVGGRIDTEQFGIRRRGTGEAPVTIRAEMGAMRYPHYHQMLSSLCTTLGIAVIDDETFKAVAWKGPFELKSLYHLRGTTLSDDLFRRGKIPYKVRPEEKGKTPAELLEYAISRMLAKMIGSYAHETKFDPKKLARLRAIHAKVEQHEPIFAPEWMKFIEDDYEFAGIPLRNIGFWNVLKHFLSSEAFLLVHDGFGFLSVISNWNAPEAFKWLLTDFSPHQRLLTVAGGFGQIVDKLEADLGNRIEPSRTLKSLNYNSNAREFRLRFEKGADVTADRVILALPPNALQKIRMFEDDAAGDNELQQSWLSLVHCSRPHRLAKVVLAYEEPWWQHTPIPGAESGRLFTDLPMRQIHYFGPRWLHENGWCDATTRLSLVMIYNDSHYEAFWRTFSVYSRVYRVDQSEHPHKTLGRRLQDIGRRGYSFWGPAKVAKHVAAFKEASEAELQAIDAEDLDDPRELRHRMEEKVRDQLREVHQYDVPLAIGGVFHDWSQEGGWHTWEPFVDVPAVKEIVVQPFTHTGKVSVRPLGSTQDNALPLYICGEAYAWEQGWIEGALMTAERVVSELVKSTDPCVVPEWFAGGSQAEFDRYMYAELPKKQRKDGNEQ